MKTLAGAALFLVAAAAPGQADNLQQSFATVPQAWAGPAAQNIRLNNGGLVLLPFANPLAGIVSVTFNAECQLIAAPTSYISISVIIDGVATPPSGSDAALCSGRGAGLPGGWVRGSFTVNRPLAAGGHNVRVTAQVFGAHTGARIDDVTIMVER
jgi:hypothetical protein